MPAKTSAAPAAPATAAPVGERKDPGIASMISVICAILLGAPAVGYFYLGKVKKGIIYLISAWILLGIVLVAVFSSAGAAVVLASMIATISAVLAVICPAFMFGWLLALFMFLLPLCGMVLFIFPIAFDIAIIYDVYLEAKGAKALLPFSEE